VKLVDEGINHQQFLARSPDHTGHAKPASARHTSQNRFIHMTDNADTNQIIPISEDYIESYHQCLDSVARERRYLAFLEAFPLEASREFVRTNIANDVPQFVAIKDGEVIGWCDISPLRFPGMTHCGRLGMGVRNGFRGLGIGEKLIRQTIAKAKEKGLERIELEVFASNQPAIRLYEKVGFVVEGVKKKARKLDGIYDDILDMALFIR
jgi:ribosomal protein S18 acetylase RimI-like enzyme